MRSQHCSQGDGDEMTSEWEHKFKFFLGGRFRLNPESDQVDSPAGYVSQRGRIIHDLVREGYIVLKQQNLQQQQ